MLTYYITLCLRSFEYLVLIENDVPCVILRRCAVNKTYNTIQFKGNRGNSTIDYIAVTNDIWNLIRRCEVVKDDYDNESDHYAVSVEIDIDIIPSPSDVIAVQGCIDWKSQHFVEKYTNAVDRKMKLLCSKLDHEPCDLMMLDEAFDTITKCLIEEGNTLPKLKRKKIIPPYCQDTVLELLRERSKHYKAYKQNGSKPGELKNKYDIANKKFKQELQKKKQDYERGKLDEIIGCASHNKKYFWNEIEKCCKPGKCDAYAIRNSNGNVVYDANEVVNAFKDHFERECTPCYIPYHNREHFDKVTRSVKEWRTAEEEEKFLDKRFKKKDIRRAFKMLRKSKLPWYDEVTAEHLINAGGEIVSVLTFLYNRIVDLVYVPKNLRRGTQVPLYKEANSSPIDPNSYSRITLLTCFNKMLDILIWGRMRKSWRRRKAIPPWQGACREGDSNLHSALLLHESIAIDLGSNKKVFVAYIDIAIAPHNVWIDGFLFRLHEMGVTGKTWKILYNSYNDFWCNVRLNSTYSDEYKIECGIHQGEYLSRLKYTAFIDPLLKEIKNSGFSHKDLATSPIGYPDAVFICSISEDDLDQALSIAYDHSRKWHYIINASKSAITVDGKGRKVEELRIKYRNIILGKGRVKEYNNLENSLRGNNGIKDRVSRGWEPFFTVTGTGVKEGFPSDFCEKMFKTGIIPIVTNGSELWVLKNHEKNKLKNFQRSIAREFQKLSSGSQNDSVYSCELRSIDYYIKKKKMRFLRKILMMQEGSDCRKILKQQADQYDKDKELGARNDLGSPVYDLLNVCKELRMYDVCLCCIRNGITFSKKEWSDIRKAIRSMEKEK